MTGGGGSVKRLHMTMTTVLEVGDKICVVKTLIYSGIIRVLRILILTKITENREDQREFEPCKSSAF